MKKELIQAVSRKVYRRFPEVRGKKPKVQMCNSPRGRSILRSHAYLLTFRSHATTSTGKTLPYYVRVVVNEEGKILKITMSR